MSKDTLHKIEVRDDIEIEWDASITMDDGLILRADIFKPKHPGRYPVLISYGPYGKGAAFQDAYAGAWKTLIDNHADRLPSSSHQYANWEVVDPEVWVKKGYVCIRVDSRGAGSSPGIIDSFSPRETQDFYQCIEWAGIQSWSNGNVGLNGISYYAINQWQVAGLKPPHLKAMCIWEGATDFYRDVTYHGGILCTFCAGWYETQVENVQYGYGERGYQHPITKAWAAGPETLTKEELAKNRVDFGAMIKAHPLDDSWHQQRSADFDRIEVPFLSAANWGGQGIHLRGNFNGFTNAASKEKWLECHGFEHWTEFYTQYGVDLQTQFFDYYLKGEENGWKNRPKVMLNIRHINDQFVLRNENEWPLARTNWTKYYLDPKHMSLQQEPLVKNHSISYMGESDGCTFLMPPLQEDTEITGPLAAKLFVSSSTQDADLFLVLRLFTPDMKEKVFIGALDPHVPVTQGWLRASHRKLDPTRTKPWQPYHTHDEKQDLIPDEIYECDIEIWPTSIVVPSGYRLGLTIRSIDYVYPCATGKIIGKNQRPLTGCGPCLHDDRDLETLQNIVTIHAGPGYPSYLLLPVI